MAVRDDVVGGDDEDDDGDNDDGDDDDLEKTYQGQKDAGNETEWVSSGETRGCGLVQRQ